MGIKYSTIGGKDKQYSQIFFEVASIYRIRELCENQEEMIKRKELQVLAKKTIPYFTSRIRFLINPNIKFTNIE